jgi:hypothetical protein
MPFFTHTLLVCRNAINLTTLATNPKLVMNLKYSCIESNDINVSYQTQQSSCISKLAIFAMTANKEDS